MEKQKKLKRIEAIIKGRKFTETLFGLKKKQIRRAIEAAHDNAEKQKEEAAIAYEKEFSRMADDDADYESVIGNMLRHKQTILAADNTLAALEEIKADLEEEIVVEED